MRTLILSLIVVSISAVEISPDTKASYLAEEFRPSWNLTALNKVLAELEQIIEVPIRRSERVIENGGDGVLFKAESRLSVLTVLEWLERTHKLHFIVEPLRLKVETQKDLRDRRRRLVDINLREFAASTNVIDFFQRGLGFTFNAKGGGGFDLFGGGGGNEGVAVSPEILLERLTKASDGDADLRAGRAYLWLTPEEEKAVRETLNKEFSNATKQIAWRIHTGLLHSDEQIPVGLIKGEDVQGIVDKLQRKQHLQIVGLQAQTVSAMNGSQVQRINDVDVDGQHHNPSISMMEHGVSCSIRSMKGRVATFAEIRFAWVEPLQEKEITLVKPELWTGGTETSSGKVELKGEKGELEVDVEKKALHLLAPQETTITQRTVWEWKPNVEIFIPFGQALVMVSDHEKGLAVFILEEVK